VFWLTFSGSFDLHEADVVKPSRCSTFPFGNLNTFGNLDTLRELETHVA
jgi:hypothetical protein